MLVKSREKKVSRFFLLSKYRIFQNISPDDSTIGKVTGFLENGRKLYLIDDEQYKKCLSEV